MSAEWTYHVSYDPFLIAVFVDPGEASLDIIAETKEFGVNMWSEGQAAQSSVAGNHSMKEVDKLPNSLFKTYKAKYIKAPMIEGCVLNAECRLVASYKVGDHTMFVGQVIAARYDANKRPLLLRGASGYHELGERIRHGPSMYLFAGFRNDKNGVVLKVQGRIFVVKENESVSISIEDSTGKSIVAREVMTQQRGLFHTRFEFDNGIPKGRYTVNGKHRD